MKTFDVDYLNSFYMKERGENFKLEKTTYPDVQVNESQTKLVL